MPRLALAALAIGAGLLLAGCGDSTVTLKITGTLNASVVVTSDSTAITSLKAKVTPTLVSGETIVDGDQHSGTHVCGFNVSKNGHTYQVDAYGSVPAATCNSAAQQQFLSQAP